MAVERRYQFKTEEDKGVVPLIGILVVLIVLVGAALYYIVTYEGEEPIIPPIIPPENVTPPANDTNVTNVTAVCGDDCHYSQAMLNQSADECNLIDNSTLAQECYEQLSDVSLPACLEVEDEGKKGFCVTSFAVSNDDIDLCDLLTSAKDSCRRQVDPCIGTEDEGLCHAIAGTNPSYCEYDTECLLNYSMDKQNYTSCRLIQNPVVAKGCESAIRKTDKCSELTLQAERDYCYQIYAIYSDDYKVCTSISKNTIYRLNCLSMFAATEGNYTICDMGGLYLDDLWACYTNYSLLAGDLDGCEAIDDLASTNKFRCTFEYAKKYGDPSACQVIDSLPSRDTCYQGTIIYSNENLDPVNCEDVTDFVWRNKCYNEAAKLYDDVTICDEIEEDFAWKACVSAYNLYKGS